MPWNAGIYNKFKSERAAPFYDLLKLLHPYKGAEVIDLGCGTGELTGELCRTIPGSVVLGIDSSPEMLAEASAYECDRLTFKHTTIQEIIRSGNQWDIVFSNAALQWVDDHRALLPGIISLVKTGGQLAIQMPSNHNHYTHTAIRQIALREPFKSALDGWTRTSPVLTTEEYATLLYNQKGIAINVFEKVFPHVLANADALAEWVSGTALVPYMDKLPGTLHNLFMDEYRKTLREKFPARPVFYPFKRIFIAARF
ncbi:MAG: methyltransferase domain-containing protein [Bacteroidia bacterium]|jgi:trans-aconitate 2-methyltransferase|nr:methyltransferase domain-containing protein [Bacteroidia bacterium]